MEKRIRCRQRRFLLTTLSRGLALMGMALLYRTRTAGPFETDAFAPDMSLLMKSANRIQSAVPMQNYRSFSSVTSDVQRKRELVLNEPTSNTSSTLNQPSKVLTNEKKSRNRGGRNEIRDKIEMSRRLQVSSQRDDDSNRTAPPLTQTYCDYLLAECVALDEWDLVLDVLDLMKNADLRQVHSTYRACLQACFETANAASAKEILSAMEMAGFVPTSTDYALAIMAMCRRDQIYERGWWRKALALHQQATLKDDLADIPVGAYDGLLACMVPDGNWKEAVRLLRYMEQPSPLSHKTRPALSTYRTVIECCVEARQAEQAVQVLQSCVDKNEVKLSTFVFELVIAALARKQQWRRALAMLDLMETLDIPRTLKIYNSVLASCAKAREPVQAKAILVRMRRKDDIRPDTISYNSVMSACASASRWREALAVLDQAYREPGVTPDVYTYTNAIRACAKGGKTRRALTLFEVVKDKGLPVDTYCYTAAIEACEWRQALKFLDEMEKKNIQPSVVTYSVIIKACGAGGQWRKALDLLEKMRDNRMPINLYVYNAAITAVSKAAKNSNRNAEGQQNDKKLWPEVSGLLNSMREDGIEPDGFSFSSAISCCGSEGRWQEALHLIEIMQGGGPKTRPNKIAYTAAISSCGRAGQVDHALRLFRQMKDQGLSADRVAYNALFSALRVSNEANAAYDLWNEMLGHQNDQIQYNRIATAKSSTLPDMITLTGAIAAMSSSGKPADMCKVDAVFKEAVQLGVILKKNDLDVVPLWDFDLSGMSLPVARAACRYTLHRIQQRPQQEKVRKLTFVTGVGPGRGSTSLREYMQALLLTEFAAPLTSTIPENSPGTVEVKRTTLTTWLSITKK